MVFEKREGVAFTATDIEDGREGRSPLADQPFETLDGRSQDVVDPDSRALEPDPETGFANPAIRFDEHAGLFEANHRSRQRDVNDGRSGDAAVLARMQRLFASGGRLDIDDRIASLFLSSPLERRRRRENRHYEKMRSTAEYRRPGCT